jgi:hypothetical protein
MSGAEPLFHPGVAKEGLVPLIWFWAVGRQLVNNAPANAGREKSAFPLTFDMRQGILL